VALFLAGSPRRAARLRDSARLGQPWRVRLGPGPPLRGVRVKVRRRVRAVRWRFHLTALAAESALRLNPPAAALPRRAALVLLLTDGRRRVAQGPSPTGRVAIRAVLQQPMAAVPQLPPPYASHTDLATPRRTARAQTKLASQGRGRSLQSRVVTP
jgi:hypothetical protein